MFSETSMNTSMKKFLFLSFIVLSCAAFGNSAIFAQEKENTPDTPIEVLMEQDATRNLNVAWQYFRLKKAYKAVLSRTEETIDAFPAFSKTDEILYLAGMSSYYLSENKGKQKLDMAILSDEDKEKYAPERLRENAVAYFSRLIELYPNSKYKDDAEKALKKLKKE